MEMTQEEKAKAYDGNYKAYTKLINRLEDVKDAIKKQNYGIAMDILCKPYPQFQVITHSELKESEDERIRNKLIEFFKGYSPDEEWWGNITQENILAWLERRGKNNMGISEATKKKLEDSLNEALEKETPESFNAFLDEQKLADVRTTGYWRVEDVEQKPAWSEEDEEIIETMCKEGDLKPSEKVWLKSLKDRVQPKQEWSEEDERFLNIAINILNSSKVYTKSPDKYEDTINWLKSLKDKSTWKPSDEQIEALEKECIAHSNYELCRLLEQLKKLREG